METVSNIYVQKLSEAKLNDGVFTGPDIRKLLTDPSFVETMNEKEKEAWVWFKDVVPNFCEIIMILTIKPLCNGC